jgi:hypothetical protein
MIARNPRRLLLAVMLPAGMFLAPPEGAASCGAESCALDNLATFGRARRWSFEVAFQTIDQDQPRIGTRDATVGEIPGHHDEVRTRTHQVSLRAQLSLSPRWFLTALVPYQDRVHSHIVNEAGLPPELKTWEYQGFGDSWLIGSWTAAGSADPSTPLTLVLQGGAKVPTGNPHVDPIGGEEPEPHVRLGTGSWDALVGGQAMHFFGAPTLSGTPSTLPVFASVMYTHTGRGTDDYKVGDMFDASTGTSYPLSERLRVLAQVNLRIRGRDESGVPHDHAAHVLVEAAQQSTPEEEAHEIYSNTGGTSLYLSPGLRFEAGGVALSTYFQAPLYQDVNGIQIVAPYHVWVGATYKLP